MFPRFSVKDKEDIYFYINAFPSLVFKTFLQWNQSQLEKKTIRNKRQFFSVNRKKIHLIESSLSCSQEETIKLYVQRSFKKTLWVGVTQGKIGKTTLI